MIMKPHYSAAGACGAPLSQPKRHIHPRMNLNSHRYHAIPVQAAACACSRSRARARSRSRAREISKISLHNLCICNMKRSRNNVDARMRSCLIFPGLPACLAHYFLPFFPFPPPPPLLLPLATSSPNASNPSLCLGCGVSGACPAMPTSSALAWKWLE